MSLTIWVGNKAYDLSNLTPAKRRYLQHLVRRNWNEHIDWESVAEYPIEAKIELILRYLGKEFKHHKRFCHKHLRIKIDYTQWSWFQLSEHVIEVRYRNRLVFAAHYPLNYSDNIPYDAEIIKYQHGKWEKLIDNIWIKYWKKKRTDKYAMARHWGSPGLTIFCNSNFIRKLQRKAGSTGRKRKERL